MLTGLIAVGFENNSFVFFSHKLFSFVSMIASLNNHSEFQDLPDRNPHEGHDDERGEGVGRESKFCGSIGLDGLRG